MWLIIGGCAMLLLAGWQFYAAYRAFREVQQHGNKHTSPFFMFADFYSFFFGLILAVSGVWMIIDGL